MTCPECGGARSVNATMCLNCFHAKQRAAITFTCEQCHCVFVRASKGGDQRRFCGRRCTGDHKRQAAAPSKSALVARKATERAERKAFREARRNARAPKAIRTQPCETCGTVTVFKTRPGRWCSRLCMRASLSWKARRRDKKHQRRARAAKVEREPLRVLDVLARDGWRCQLCGCSTPKRLRGQMVDNAPELDHIVPLACGGPHTYANTQCACRRCNGAKGTNTVGQLRLSLDVTMR